MAGNDNRQLEEAKRLLQEINTLRARLNQQPLTMTDADAVANVQSLRNELRGVQNAFQDVDDSATSLYDQVRAISGEFKNQPGALQKIRSSMKKITSIAEDLKLQEQGIKDLSTKQLDDLAQRLKENKKILDDESTRLLNGEDLSDIAQREVQALQDLIQEQGGLTNMTRDQVDAALELVNVMDNLSTEQKAALANYVDQGNALGNIEDKISAIKEQQKEVNNLMGVGGAVVDGLDGLMGKLGMSSSRFKDAVSEAKDKMKATAEAIQSGAQKGNKLTVLMSGLGPLAKGFGAALLDPLTIIMKIVDAFFKLDKASTEVQRLTGQNSDLVAGANMRYATSVDYLETVAELTKQTGMNAQNIFTPDVIAGAAELKNTMGLAADEAGGLAMIAQTTGGNIDKTVDSIVAETSAFNKANRSAVSQGQVLRDVAKTSDGIKASLGGNPKLIAAAATQARRLGMELSQVDGIASSLLDFEDSISKEMEAELLTGKDLNLNKARELALNNDLAGVGNELFKNAADINEFGKMNRIQQESYAAALGMTRDQLGKIAYQKAIESGMTEEQAAAAANVNAEDMKRAEVQERIQKSVDKLAQAFAPILSIIGDIVNILAPIVQVVGGIVGWVVKLASEFSVVKYILYGIVAIIAAQKIAGFFGTLVGGASSFLSSIKNIGSSFSGMMDTMKGWGQGIKDAFSAGKSGAGKITEAAKTATDAAGPVADTASKVAGPVADKATEAAKSAQGVSKTAGTGIKEFLTNLGEGLRNLGKKFGDVLKGILALGLAAVAIVGPLAGAMLIIKDVPAAAMIAFAASIGVLGYSLAQIGKNAGDVGKGGLALIVAGAGIAAAAFGFSLLKGIDPVGMLAFSGAVAILGLSLIVIGKNATDVIKGAAAMLIVGAAIVVASYGLSMLSGIDPTSMMVFAGSLIALGLAAALLGTIASQVMMGAVALLVLGAVSSTSRICLFIISRS